MPTGINATAHQVGNLFVKPITKGGSPHAEVAASKAFKLMGVPHIPVRSITFRNQPAVVSKWKPGLNASQAYPGYAQRHPDLTDPQRRGTVGLADYVVNAADRHGGNYMHVPGEGVLSIDHGESWHPANAYWPKYQEGEPFHDYASLKEPHEWSLSPKVSAYHTMLHPSTGLSREHPDSAPIDPQLIDRVVQHADEIENLAYEGTAGLPEEERVLAKLATRLRIQHLAQHRPKTLGELHDMHQQHVLPAALAFTRRPK